MAPITNKFTRWVMGPERLQQYEKQEREREALEALQGVGADVQRLLMAGGQGAQGAGRDTVEARDGTEIPRVGPSYEDMLRMQANAKGVGESVLTLPEIRARMQGLQAQYGDVEAVQKAGETVEGMHAQDAIRRYQMAGAPALAASEGIDKDKLTDMALSNPNMSPEEIQRIAEGQVLLEQGGNTRRGVGEMFLEGNVSDRADVFRNTLQLSDEAQADEVNEFGRSSVGAALAHTKANPQLVKRLKDTVQMMRETGNYDEIALKAAEDTAESDVRFAQQMLARELFKPETERRKGEETLGIKTQTAAATAAAGKAAGIQAEYATKAGIPGSFAGSQYLAGNYANRIKQSEQALDRLTDEGFDPSTMYNQIATSDALELVRSPQQKQYAQAMRNFINATLRRESGAAIAESEFSNAIRQYFPRVNDDPDTKAQKKRNREAVFKAFRAEAGGAYDQIQGQEGPSGRRPAQTDSYENLRNKYGY